VGYTESAWRRQQRSWAALSALHPASIDLGRTALIRGADVESLSDPHRLASLIVQLGLNDEALDEFPAELHAHCGQGLRIWQYPLQFARYLARLSTLRIRSYLEIGIRHGGSLVATVEYLSRFHPLDFAIGVDVIDCPSIAAYRDDRPEIAFWCTSTQSGDFAARLDRLEGLDLVLIDSHHVEHQCRRELELLLGRASLIAFHDVANIGCPGVRTVWEEVRRLPGYECFEYVDQYPGLGPFMGIGLAVTRERLRQVDAG